MGRFETLEDGDARLHALLEGDSGIDDVRPVLVSSLNPASAEAHREWTFEFLPLDQVRHPALPLVWLKALRPDTWVLSLGPILATFGWLVAWTKSQGIALDFLSVGLTVAGIVSLHAAINLFNDYHDHMRGWDRVSQHGGARVISRGWLKARDVKFAAWALFSLAFALGLAVILRHLSPAGLIAIAAFVMALEFAISRFGWKYKGYGEVIAWFMFGPLLTGGFTWAVCGRLPWQSLALGTVFGSIALLTIHLKGFERILVDSQARLKTWPVRAGFDASKTFAQFCLALVLLSAAVIALFVDPVLERALPVLVLTAGAAPLALRVQSLESPLAGRLRGLHAVGLGLAWLALISFVLGDVLRHFAWLS